MSWFPFAKDLMESEGSKALTPTEKLYTPTDTHGDAWGTAGNHGDSQVPIPPPSEESDVYTPGPCERSADAMQMQCQRKSTPYSKVPNCVFDLPIGPKEKLVLIYLIRCSNNGSKAFPSYETIAEKCSISRRSAINAVKKLVEAGVATVQRRPKNNKDNLPNVYAVLLPSVNCALGPSANSALASANSAPYKELTYKEPLRDKELLSGSYLSGNSNRSGNVASHHSERASTLSFEEFLTNHEVDAETEQAIKYFLAKYRETFGREHMKLKAATWERICDTLFTLYDEGLGIGDDLDLEAITCMIDHYFEKASAGKYRAKRICITHFNNDGIKKVNFYEAAY